MPWGRKRGAQPGNRNAWKHGIYAGIFGNEGDKVLRRARRMDPQKLHEEIAILRTAIVSLGNIEKGNLELLSTVMRTLIRAVAVHHGLNKQQEDGIHHSMLDLLKTLIPAAGGL